MIQFPNTPVRLVEHVSELPDCRNARDLVFDVETRSGDKKRSGDNPWGGDRICGASVTWDDHAYAYYVPVRHASALWNLPVESFQSWLKDVIESAQTITGQNIKFDMHFAKEDGAVFRGELFDTLNCAKLIDSDRGFGRGGYALDSLSSDWLDEDVSEHDQRIQAYLKSIKSKDYADVPADVMAPYAGNDVLAARKLKAYILQQRDALVSQVPRFSLIWQIEQLLTPVLWDMETTGVRVDPQELMIEDYRTSVTLARLQEELHQEVGYPIEPSNSADCFELICNKLGLPVLSRNESGNPSFDKEALTSYLHHPLVAESAQLTASFMKMLYYRKLHTLQTLFINPFRKYHDARHFMHPQYTQTIRTGRMSCKRPNNQQNSKDSKALIHPDGPDRAFLCSDGSQIEFRLIAHYSRDQEILEAYARDPDTDFHQWVADMCGIPRKPAKNVNFAIGYGGGKAKVLSMLSGDMTLVGSLGGKVDELIRDGLLPPSMRQEAFHSLCQARAEQVYNEYHGRLPGIRRVTKKAGLLTKTTGMVFNELGRVRRLPPEAAFRSFNSLTQGLGSDLVKAGMVRLAPRYNSTVRGLGLDLRINVHDEVVFEGPTEIVRRPDVQSYVTRQMEIVDVPLRVPIRFATGWAAADWRAASDDASKVQVDRELRLLEEAA